MIALNSFARAGILMAGLARIADASGVGTTIVQRMTQTHPDGRSIVTEVTYALREDGATARAFRVEKHKDIPGFHERVVFVPADLVKAKIDEVIRSKSTYPLTPGNITGNAAYQALLRASSCVPQAGPRTQTGISLSHRELDEYPRHSGRPAYAQDRGGNR